MAPRDSKFGRIALIIFFLLLLGYGLYEAWGMISGPSITVPADTTTVWDEYVLISGRAERITELRLNGAPISVSAEGDFAEPYLLAPGTNHIILEARDARGREDREEVDILYVPRETPYVPPAFPATTTEATSTEPAILPSTNP